MRNWLSVATLSAVIFFGMATVACGGNKPSKVVRQVWVAIEKGDANAYGELMTPEAAGMVTMFGEKAKNQSVAKGGIVKTEETIDGDTAVVKVTFKDGSTSDFDLIKVDGKWKVTIKK